MALSLLLKRPCLLLIFFLIANPVNSKLYDGSKEGNYRGCIAVFNTIRSNGEISLTPVLGAYFGSMEARKGPDSTFGSVEKYVRDNPDKVVAAAGLVVSSCLLYHSIQLAHDIRLFYEDFKELRRKFDEFMETKLPKIEKLLMKVLKKIETGSAPDDKEYQHAMFVLKLFHEEVQDVLRNVNNLIEEAMRAQAKSNQVAGVSFVAVAAVAWIVLSPLVPMYGLGFKLGMGATASMGAAAGVLSLVNANHCRLALKEMRHFKKELEALNNSVLHMHVHFEKESLHNWWSDFTFWAYSPDVF